MAGLAAASALSQAGLEVVLLEASDYFGKYSISMGVRELVPQSPGSSFLAKTFIFQALLNKPSFTRMCYPTPTLPPQKKLLSQLHAVTGIINDLAPVVQKVDSLLGLGNKQLIAPLSALDYLTIIIIYQS